MGEDKIADLLAGANTAAMADHHPRMRAQYSEVIANRLGVAGADANVNERDALTILTDEMIGGHLVLAPCGVGQLLVRVIGLRINI